MQVIEREELDRLIGLLAGDGYEVIGPTLRDDAIQYGPVRGIEDLPAGWTDEQDGGHYRLRRRDDRALFGYVVGPQSWKQYLFPPSQTIFRARRDADGLHMEPAPVQAPKRAFLGMRACELHALAIQDQVFTEGPYVDEPYERRRGSIFRVAVNCGQAGGTCFCVSMETGPRADRGFDLALTEILEGGRHYFTLEVGSDAGQAVADRLSASQAGEDEHRASMAATEAAAAQMGRQLDTQDLPALLMGNLEHPRWDEVADRCLSCANCTMVCPTCFCSSVHDSADLAGSEAVRERVWDSCFNQAFSYIAGGSIRSTPVSRYRQWMTHKLATWHEQFGTSGCVGCGRCITWCPVGIDITEEAAAIRATDQRRKRRDG
ncbi:4Fe-4S dicluster domain-containing protein [Ectothiorhodospiraceae bacterium WFHF3C12]|nr:4Fe-4S dicluster domain-containing protein [Ectothiorhodospiraceae bacterium WFHF3C12]